MEGRAWLWYVNRPGHGGRHRCVGVAGSTSPTQDCVIAVLG